MAFYYLYLHQIIIMYRINKDIIKEYNRTRAKKVRNTLCQAPFSNLYFSRNGDIISCCFNRDYVLGKYPDDSPDKIWKSKKIKQFRNALKHNKFEKGCEICSRELNNRNYHGVIARHFDFLVPNRKFPVMMEFELDNICNLECIMCEGQFSSSIRSNREKKAKFATPYDDRFTEYIKPFLRKAKLLRFGGGEPFLIPLYYDMWDYVIEKNKDCKIYIQTNGTIINQRIRKWLKTGRFEIGVSLDSLDKKRFETIRQNASLQQVLLNINEFISLIPTKPNRPALVISATVTNLNWQDVPSLIEYANKIHAQMVFNTVWTPIKYAIHNLSSNKLVEITDFYKNYHIKEEHTPVSKHNAKMFESLINQTEEWKEKADEKENALLNIKNCDDAAIVNKIIEKVVSHDSESKPLQNKITLLDRYIQKYPDYRRFLELIYLLPTNDVIEALKTYSVSELIDKLKEKSG
jgi:radical SAM protein with 4Fe4S-binding SPASM domain